MTEFAGYDMPLWYTTTTEEHMAVRNSSGMFDVSHMGRFHVRGSGSSRFLESMVPTNVESQPPGKAFYTLLLNDRAGIIDDLIIMKLKDEEYILVVNAANAETDMAHIRANASSGVEVMDHTGSTAMVAVQGPKAQESLQPLTDLDLGQLKRFRFAETSVAGQKAIVSRTGYTGEDGFELIIRGVTNENPDGAVAVWKKLGGTTTPCGLGARDSLRLEAGFPLHGSDIDQETNPFQADLAWVISQGKSGYIGSRAVSELSSQPPDVIKRGVVLDQGIPRHGFQVVDESGSLGTVTSGTFSPTIRKGIALCRVKYGASELGEKVRVVVRESPQEGVLVKPPFYDEQVYGWKRRSNGN